MRQEQSCCGPLSAASEALPASPQAIDQQGRAQDWGNDSEPEATGSSTMSCGAAPKGQPKGIVPEVLSSSSDVCVCLLGQRR